MRKEKGDFGKDDWEKGEMLKRWGSVEGVDSVINKARIFTL